MEIKYPFLFITLVILVLVYLFIFKIKKEKYINGSKIANTNYIKDTSYYQRKLRIYKRLKIVVNISFIISIILLIMLSSRLVKIKSINTHQYNRDIYLCMDVSASVDELNSELIDSLKNVVKSLKGDRFGILIFNTSAVTLVPLTEDYQYVTNILDNIKNSIIINNDYSNIYSETSLYDKNYIISGTQEDSDIRGGSLIGDGLLSCVYSFSNLEENRTRLIILSTDNDLNGNPIVTLSESADISKNKGIKVFGVATSSITDKNKIEFKNAVLKTGGKFYEQGTSTVNDIVNDIDNTSKSLLENYSEIKKIDIIEIPFLILMLSVSLVIILKNIV